MNKKIFQIVFFILILLSFGVVLNSYINNMASNPDKFESLVASFPQTPISRTSVIRIEFTKDFDKGSFALNQGLKSNILSFNPHVGGKIYWINKRTLEFQPNEPLPPNSSFLVKVKLDKIFETYGVSGNFKFKVETIKQDMEVYLKQVKYLSPQTLYIQKATGYILLADYMNPATLQNLITAQQNFRSLPVSIRPGNRENIYLFTIDSIQRTQKSEQVKLKWQLPNDENTGDSLEIEVPSLNNFSLLRAGNKYSPQKHYEIIFNDPIDTAQQVDTLISIKNITIDSISVHENSLAVHFPDTNGAFIMEIDSAFKNTRGVVLNQKIQLPIVIRELEPDLALEYPKSLFDASEKTIQFPVNAINLKKVKVTLYEVLDKNILQFMQINHLNEYHEIERVGIPIQEFDFDLRQQVNYNPESWQTYQLKLTDISFQKSGFYHINISYNADNVVFPFSNKKDTVDSDSLPIIKTDSLPKSNASIKHNFLVTDFSLIVKKATQDSLWIFAHSLTDKEALKNVNIKLYNFHQQLIDASSTDSRGVAHLQGSSGVGFIVAEHNNYRYYLKLSNKNQQLFQSHLYKGIAPKNGIKGYFFSTTHHWMPGDTLKTGFLIHEKTKSLAHESIIRSQLVNSKKKIAHTVVESFNGEHFRFFNYLLPKNAEPGQWKLKYAVGNANFEKKLWVGQPHKNGKKETDTISPPVFNEPKPLKQDFDFWVEKDSAHIGDTVFIHISGPRNKKILVTVENEQGILHDWLVDLKNSKDKMPFVLKEKMVPSLFIYFNDLEQENVGNRTDCFYKRIYVMGNKSPLQPFILINKEVKPQEPVNLTIGEKLNRNMEYIILITNQLKNNKLNPQDYFMQPERLSIKNWGKQSFSASTIEPKALHRPPPLPTIYTDSTNSSSFVEYLGPFNAQTKPRNHIISFPSYIGNASVSVIARSPNSGYGFAHENLRVFKPIMVTLNSPQKVAPSETISLPATIYLHNTQKRDIQVELIDNENIYFVTLPEFTFVNDTHQYQKLSIVIKTPPRLDTARFTMRVSDNKNQAEKQVVLPISSNNPLNTNTKSTTLQPGEKWQFNYVPKGVSGSNTAQLNYSSYTSVNIPYWVNVLDHEPTISYTQLVNGRFPLLYLNQIMQLTDADNTNYRHKIQKAINVLKDAQLPSGGYSVFKESSHLDLYFTSYVGCFLIEAKRYGFIVDEAMLNRWIRFQQRNSMVWNLYDNESQTILAIQLYSLSLLDKVDLETLTKLKESVTGNTLAKLTLALTYLNLNQPKKARELVLTVENDLAQQDQTSVIAALKLEYYRQTNNKDLMLLSVNEIEKYLASNNNIQATPGALSLIVLLRHLQKTNDIKYAHILYRINKGKTKPLSHNRVINQLNIPVEFTLPKIIEADNIGNEPLFMNFYTTGSPLNADNLVKSSPLTLSVKYEYKNHSKVNLLNIKKDSVFYATLEIKNKGGLHYSSLGLKYRLPTGWLVLESKLPPGKKNMFNLRHHEIVYFFELEKHNKMEVKIPLKAQFRGNFNLPAIELINYQKTREAQLLHQAKTKVN